MRSCHLLAQSGWIMTEGRYFYKVLVYTSFFLNPPLSIVTQKLWSMSSRDDRPESLIFRVTGAHRVESWLCMVRLENTETAHALCLWCWTLAPQFFIYNSTSVNNSQSSTLSNTSRVTKTVDLTGHSQIWTCGTVIKESKILKSWHSPIPFYGYNSFKAAAGKILLVNTILSARIAKYSRGTNQT